MKNAIMMADANTVLWLVVENTPTKHDPRAATLLYVVRVVDEDKEVRRLGDVLSQYGMLAFKETYGKYFNGAGWKKRAPISLQRFIETISRCNPYDEQGIRRQNLIISAR